MIKRLVVLACVLTAGLLQAQDTTGGSKKLKLDFNKVNLESQPTPQINATNIVDKRWKPKTWLEIDSDFEIKLPTSEGREASFPSITINYYLVMNATTKDGRRVLLKGSVAYVNIPGHEKVHALAFVSPSTLKAALKKENGGKGDVMGYYIEIEGGGEKAFKTLGGAGSKWWEDTTKFDVRDGAVLGKDKTPFAPFWGDYDVTPQSK